ncbi:unnamed protein product [Rhodiola kirilowii]
MEIDGGGGDGRRSRRMYLPTEARLLREGIGILLTRWSALQMAVDFEWGGRNSRLRARHLVHEIFDWFTRSRELFVDDLEELLHDCMLSLNTMIEDGSIEEVAENLMVLHEECLEGNYTYVQNLRARPRPAAGSHVRQGLDGDEDSGGDLVNVPRL